MGREHQAAQMNPVQAAGTPQAGRTRHLFMGEHKGSRQAEDATATWEQRKAERAARIEAALADPVERFYLLHGYPDGGGPQMKTSGNPAVAEDQEPGPA